MYLAARKRGLATEGFFWVAITGLAFGIFGAKLGQWSLGQQNLPAAPLAWMDPHSGGRTLIGGILLGWIGVVLARRRLGIQRPTGDLFALALPAGEAIGRIGCLLNGCCYGLPVDRAAVPWAILQHGAWRHPAQVYAALYAAAMFGALAALQENFRREGDLFRLYLVLFGAGRFVLEFWREREILVAGVSLAQLVCLGLAVGAGYLWWRERRGDARGETECPETKPESNSAGEPSLIPGR